MKKLLTTTIAILALSMLSACGETPEPVSRPGDASQGMVVHSLQAHSAEFEPGVIEVTDGVHVAVGYALANSIMLEGDDAVVIIDVTESVESARAVMAEFRKITDKPVAALIYTHNHADHVFGGKGFVEDESVPVYAHDSTNFYINRVANIIRPAIESRSSRMFGTLLPRGPEGVVNSGIGPFLAQGGHSGGTVGLLRPTHTFSDRLELEVAGIRIELMHAPGETNDQILVWLPDKKVLLPGDNVYKAFPNLYTIRGTLYRDVMQWAQSLDLMRSLRPEHLVPSHTRPLSGSEEVMEVLTIYRDAIQYVHDQTIRGINQGLTPDQLVQQVQLPPHMKQHPWLLEHYGTVEWSVRNVFNGYLGWFGGDAALLSPVTPEERGLRLVRLAGGTEAALAAAQAAFDTGDYKWAAELAGHILQADSGIDAARKLKASSLRQLGYASTSPNGRHYYLTQALELEGVVDLAPASVATDRLDFIHSLPIGEVLSSMPVNLNPDKSAGESRAVNLYFADTGERYELRIRNSILLLSATDTPDAKLQVETTTDTWVDILLGARGVPGALASGDIRLGNGMLDVPELLSFLLLFK